MESSKEEIRKIGEIVQAMDFAVYDSVCGRRDLKKVFSDIDRVCYNYHS